MNPDFPHDAAHLAPYMMVVMPLIVGSTIIAAIILVRWLMSKSAWNFHPGGANGFLYDEFLRLGAIFIPYMLIGVALRWYIYVMHPELSHSPALIGALVVIFIMRRFSRYIPFVRDAGNRIDAARAACKAGRAA
ncbi:hypothetical protein PQU92_00575 [Asticcacaulis sp. BYS171W]|uniref:Uncharacterized protein n=1 Tax=Asticcacaulis aquaticus TaxID=2984212 RepID=A0ABT5HPH2_9CAUL|nr:hypothetical protein [Asticcacaulis aquaticus]MDC7681755.1 hypothetical protein [Asticcacaulis aquaticus]